MKYGVGQWTAILNTGLLPGKVVGQLNSQTQRLLGQQSLAGVQSRSFQPLSDFHVNKKYCLVVFSGLRIDVEKIRKDNAAKTKVTRKGGVIINTGSQSVFSLYHDHGRLVGIVVLGKLSIEEIEEMKSEISRKYALTNHQQIEVDQKLNKLQNMKLKCNNNLQIVQNLSSLLDCDTKGLNRQARIEHLGKLREELKALESQYDNQIALSSASSLKNMEPHDCLKISTETDGENPTQTRSSSGSSRSKRSKRPRTNAKYIIPENNPISVDEPLDSSIEAIMNLGYSRRHAIDALFETENNLEAAIDWLLLNCN
eukprot:g2520.t1